MFVLPPFGCLQNLSNVVLISDNFPLIYYMHVLLSMERRYVLRSFLPTKLIIIFLDSTKLEIVWIKITFFKRRVSIISRSVA